MKGHEKTGKDRETLSLPAQNSWWHHCVSKSHSGRLEHVCYLRMHVLVISCEY